jgi:hypothetical protein
MLTMIDLNINELTRVNANQVLTNETLRSYRVPCSLVDNESVAMAFGAQCRGSLTAVAKEWGFPSLVGRRGSDLS